MPLRPLSLCFILGIAGLLLKKRWLVGVGLGVLYVSALRPVSDFLVRGLEEWYPAVEVAACPKADAVLVLSGMLADDQRTSSTEWDRSVDRFERGVELVQAGHAPCIVFTAARIPWQLNPESEGARLRKEALKRGIAPEQALVTDREVQNTADEGRAVRAVMQARGWKKVILVTSAFHMARAMRMMKRSGVEAIPFPADYSTGPHYRSDIRDIVPATVNLEGTELALREWMGMAYYALPGR
jgi:uncharacterized SAM-binding protein YcdF (DUF218 family)